MINYYVNYTINQFFYISQYPNCRQKTKTKNKTHLRIRKICNNYQLTYGIVHYAKMHRLGVCRCKMCSIFVPKLLSSCLIENHLLLAWNPNCLPLFSSKCQKIKAIYTIFCHCLLYFDAFMVLHLRLLFGLNGVPIDLKAEYGAWFNRSRVAWCIQEVCL